MFFASCLGAERFEKLHYLFKYFLCKNSLRNTTCKRKGTPTRGSRARGRPRVLSYITVTCLSFEPIVCLNKKMHNQWKKISADPSGVNRRDDGLPV